MKRRSSKSIFLIRNNASGKIPWSSIFKTLKEKKACHLRILHPFNRKKKKYYLLDAVKKKTLIARSFRGMNIVKTLQLQKCGGIS